MLHLEGIKEAQEMEVGIKQSLGEFGVNLTKLDLQSPTAKII